MSASTAGSGGGKPRRSLPRRLLRWAAILALLAIVGRIGLVFGLPVVARRLAAAYELDLSWGEMNLSLLQGRTEIWDLSLGAPGEEPFLTFDFLHADLNVAQLLGGDISLRRVEVDGLEILVERGPDGSLTLLDQLEPLIEGLTGDPELEAEPDPEVDAIELGLPLEISALRAHDVLIQYRDRSLSTPLDIDLRGVVRASSLGSEQREAQLEFVATSPGCLDILRVLGVGSSGGQNLDLDLEVAVAGLHPRPLAPLLASFAIDPRAEDIDLRLDTKLTARACAGRTDACGVELEIRDVHVLADVEESLALERLTVSATELSAERLDGARIELEGAHAVIRRLPTGEVSLTGLALGGAPAPLDPDADPTAPAIPTYRAPDPTAPIWPVVLEAAELHGASLRFIDEAIPGGSDLRLEVDELTLGELAWDPARAGEATPLRGRLHAPGLAGSIDVDGELVLFAREQSMDLELTVDELRPEAAEAYLAEADLGSDFEKGRLSLRLMTETAPLEGGRSSLTLTLADLDLADGEETLFELDRLAVVGLQRDISRSLLRAEELVIEGTRGGVRWDESGDLHALGLGTRLDAEVVGEQPRGAQLLDSVVILTEAMVPEVETLEAILNAIIPGQDARIELGSFSWSGAQLTFVDEGFPEPRVLELADLGAEIDDLVLGYTTEEDPAPPATMRLWLGIEDVIERLTLEGRVFSRPGPINADVSAHLAIEGLTGAWLRPYLEGTGVEPLYNGGALDLDLSGRMAVVEGGVDGEVGLSGLSFRVGGERVLGLDALTVKDAQIRSEKVRVASVEIAGPYLRTARDAFGAFEVAGLRIHPLPDEDGEAAAESTPSGGSKSAAAPPSQAATDPSIAAQAEAGLADDNPIDFELDRLVLAGAALEWSDAMASPAIEARLGFTGEIDRLHVLEEVASLSYDGAFEISDTLEELRLRGDLTLGRGVLKLAGDLEGRGLSTGSLGRYLPAGQHIGLEDGRLGLAYSADIARVDPDVPKRFRLELASENLYLRDGPDGEDVLAMDSSVVRAELLDFVEGIFEFDELSVRGLRTAVTRTPDGAVHLLGFDLPAEGGDVEPAPPPGVVVEAAGLRQAFRAQTPRISIETLDLELAELSIHDQTVEGSQPLELGLQLTNPEPLVLLDRDPDALPAMDLRLDGFARPLVQDFEVLASIEPYATHPTAKASVEFRGLYGAGITDLFPELAERFSGEGMSEGELRFDVAGQLLLDRRNPLEFDPSRDFGLLLELLDVELRREPGADPLMALEALLLDAARISPSTGEVHLRTLGLSHPYCRAVLREDHLEIGGLIILLPELAAAREAVEAGQEQAIGEQGQDPGVDVTTIAAKRASASVLADAQAIELAEPGPELRLDNLVLTEIDFDLTDEVAEPPVHVPLEDLYLEVDGLSSLALTEPRPVQFNGFVNAGVVELPGRKGGPPEMRPFFSEVALSGRVQVYPQLEGWTKVSLSGMELLNMRARAEQAGVIISDGVMDSSLRLRFRDDTRVHVDSVTVFTNLSVSEAENGPIRGTLNLPAPLNTVIALLEGPGGELRVPLSFDVEPEGFASGDIFLAASAAFASMVSTAIATSPIKIGGAVTGLLGLGGGESEPEPARIERFQFAPGDTTLTSKDRAVLTELKTELARNKTLVLRVEHELGGLDLVRAERLANPSREESAQLVARLRQRRAELIRMRDELATRARTWLLVGDEEAVMPSRIQLHELHLELARVEESLDQICGMLRSDADRRRDQRTRQSCAELSRLRLVAAERGLREGLTPEQAARIEIRRARFKTPEGGLAETGGRLVVTLVERR